MSVLLKLSRFARRRYPVSDVLRCRRCWLLGNSEGFTTMVQQAKNKGLLRVSLIGVGVGVMVGSLYSWYRITEARKDMFLEGKEMEVTQLKYKPPASPSRKVVFPTDTTELKLTLFQYQTCPFCCKVRVFLDYYGISYDVVEVDPVLRSEISWSTYKKVPILVVQTEQGHQPLNDSSMIVSLLASHLHDKSHVVKELAKYYPSFGVYDENGKFKWEILNRYFLMFKNTLPNGRTNDDIVEERKWRQWADDVLVHTLSPNVYRTIDEAYRTFNWFSEVGKWEEYFPTWERLIIVNVGAMAMWMIAKRLKKRHNLKDSVRQSLYDEVNVWTNEVRARGGSFMGGNKPDLSDLAVYGVLKSIEGCDAFKDTLSNTSLGVWYEAMEKEVASHAGSKYLKS